MSKLSIITRMAEQSTAVKLSYNANGSLASTEATARAVGTTVAIQGLFQPLAVRHKVLDTLHRSCFCHAIIND